MENSKTTSDRVFIDENLNLHLGDAASSLLEERASLEMGHFDPHCGITRVDRERWEEAQRYERRTWMENARHTLSDRNEDHRERFANYVSLRGLTFNRGIELGCGPFTNLRFILEHCRVNDVHLLDPLIEEYLGHPYCYYRLARLGGILRQENMPCAGDLRHPFRFLYYLRSCYRAGGFRGKGVSFEENRIETYQTNLKFDLVVMINVLEHCQDADRVFAKVLEIATWRHFCVRRYLIRG